MRRTLTTLGLVTALLITTGALAQTQNGGAAMPGMAPMPGMSGGDGAAAKGPADKAMMDAMTKMDDGMAKAASNGNTDHDFVTMMIPHHQGAVDMAKAELQYGKDPQIRALAKAIIRAQIKEIAEMRRWLARHH